MANSSAFPASSYSPPEESFKQDLSAIVESTVKKYVDNLMRFLEGISSRLSQLELYCYNIEKSIGELRSELARDNGEADSKLKFLEKHLQEVILLHEIVLYISSIFCRNVASCMYHYKA